jgi:hypothetical protein
MNNIDVSALPYLEVAAMFISLDRPLTVTLEAPSSDRRSVQMSVADPRRSMAGAKVLDARGQRGKRLVDRLNRATAAERTASELARASRAGNTNSHGSSTA